MTLPFVRRSLSPLFTCCLLLIFAPLAVQAQRSFSPVGAHRVESVPLSFSDAPVGLVAQTAPGQLPTPFKASGEKDPFVAGVLSFLIPGTGSFYAGSKGHGWRHLIIHVGSYVVFYGAAVSCVNSYDGCDSESSAAGVSALTLVANNIWSIFTAVGDARRTRGSTGSSGRVVGDNATQ